MSGRLLLVDDDSSVREVAALSLARVGGWEVRAVGSGGEAIELLRSGETFDAILLDVMMPGVDGPATLARMRAGGLLGDVPVVFLTAKIAAADRERLEALGVSGILAKPFDPMTMPGELAGLVDRADCKGTVPADLMPAWQRARPTIGHRLDLVDAAIGAAPQTGPTAGLTAAHSLAGVLGTFGLAAGSELAREIEAGLESGADPRSLRSLAEELRSVVAVGSR